ncbi:MAG: ester cyclase [Ignavibacteriae bacterium]|nr:ester cyclase [Ignavibacteriota bacterium]
MVINKILKRTSLFFLIATLSSIGCAKKDNAERNKDLAHRFHMDIFQAEKLDVADEILTSDFQWHGGMAPPQEPSGPEGVKRVATVVISAFPDRQITHHDAIAEGDKVLIRWSMSGTHKDDLMGIAPTGKSITVTGFDYFRISDGKIAEMWQEIDQLGMMRQLGVIPVSSVPAGYIDPVRVSPNNYKRLLENEHVRILEMRLKAGKKDQVHSHPSETVYFVKGSKVRIHIPDAEAIEAEIPDGHVMWHEAWTHQVENIGTADLYAIIVESK